MIMLLLLLYWVMILNKISFCFYKHKAANVPIHTTIKFLLILVWILTTLLPRRSSTKNPNIMIYNPQYVSFLYRQQNRNFYLTQCLII